MQSQGHAVAKSREPQVGSLSFETLCPETTTFSSVLVESKPLVQTTISWGLRSHAKEKSKWFLIATTSLLGTRHTWASGACQASLKSRVARNQKAGPLQTADSVKRFHASLARTKPGTETVYLSRMEIWYFPKILRPPKYYRHSKTVTPNLGKPPSACSSSSTDIRPLASWSTIWTCRF